jgi:hypothetical protein
MAMLLPVGATAIFYSKSKDVDDLGLGRADWRKVLSNFHPCELAPWRGDATRPSSMPSTPPKRAAPTTRVPPRRSKSGAAYRGTRRKPSKLVDERALHGLELRYAGRGAMGP